MRLVDSLCRQEVSLLRRIYKSSKKHHVRQRAHLDTSKGYNKANEIKMKEQVQTKEQLITELEDMRQRIAELEKAEIERDRLKHKLLQSETLYKAVAENSPSAIYLFQDGDLKFINDAFIRLSGYTKEELMEMDYLKLIHPDDREMMKKATEQALTGDISNLPPEPELKVIRKNGEIKWVKLTPALTKYNGKYAIVGNVMDITSFKRTEQELKYRVEFDNLITTISTQFINLPIDEIDNGINHALRQIGEFAAVDRSYLFQIYDNGKKMDNTHEWCAEGIEPQIDNLKNLLTSDFLWAIEKFKQSETIYIPRVVDLPPEASAEKEILQAQDIQSLILVPIIFNGNLTGFLGFDSVRREKVWEREIIALLRIVGEIFAHALHRKRVEAAIRASEAKYRAVVENAGEAIVVAQDGVIKFANPKATEITGYLTEELTRKPFVEFIHSDHREMVLGFHLNRLRGEELPNIYPFKIIDNSGNIKWVEINTVLITWEGRPATLNFLNDITERKRAEEELKESREKYRKIFELSPEAIVLIDRAGNLLDVNRRLYDWLAYEPKTVIGKHLLELPYLPEESKAKVKEKFRQRMAGEDVPPYELDFIHKNGEKRIGWIIAKPIRDLEGKIVQDFVMISDITERKRVEAELNQYREHLEVMVKDRTAQLMTANEQLKQEIKGRKVAEAELTRYRGQLEEMVAKRTAELKTVNQQLRLEIEERKRAEEKVRLYQKQLRALASELSLAEERERRRIAMELHDDIGQNLALANIKLGGLRELVSATEMTEAVDQLRELIQQVIQHTRSLTSTLSPPLLYELGLVPAVEWLVKQIKKQSGIHCDFWDDEQPKPMADDIRITLFKVVRELLVNIVKHSQAHNAKISILRDGDNIKISVEDNGVGFDTSKLDSNFGGTGGFGLFNIRERLYSLGGCLEIKSELDKGTRVTFWAPLKRNAKNHE